MLRLTGPSGESILDVPVHVKRVMRSCLVRSRVTLFSLVLILIGVSFGSQVPANVPGRVVPQGEAGPPGGPLYLAGARPVGERVTVKVLPVVGFQVRSADPKGCGSSGATPTAVGGAEGDCAGLLRVSGADLVFAALPHPLSNTTMTTLKATIVLMLDVKCNL